MSKLRENWIKHIDFLTLRRNSLKAGFFIGCGNAAYGTLLYFFGKKETLNNSVDAVFGSATTQYMFIVLFSILLSYPFTKVLVDTLIVVYDTIIFGMSFLFANIYLVTIFHYLFEVKGDPLGFISNLAVLYATASVFAIIGFFPGPLFSSDINEIFWPEAGKKIKNYLAYYLVLYVVWVIAFGYLIYFSWKTLGPT